MEMTLNKLFANQDFLTRNKDCKTVEEIFEAVKAEGEEVSMEELQAYLAELSAEMHKSAESDELTESDLENVTGGELFISLGAAAAIVGGCYAIGLAIGQAIYYFRNR